MKHCYLHDIWTGPWPKLAAAGLHSAGGCPEGPHFDLTAAARMLALAVVGPSKAGQPPAYGVLEPITS